MIISDHHNKKHSIELNKRGEFSPKQGKNKNTKKCSKNTRKMSGMDPEYTCRNPLSKLVPHLVLLERIPDGLLDDILWQ
jgi:hypothetical protein